MTSVEKRRSGRKRGGHRKHSDGAFSDASSNGSFLDETDREVSNLTDRAFRSLCIGDEAVFNDSDLSTSSPCSQRDTQQAFSHSGLDREDREKKELKRAAHESFSLRMQQYGQELIRRGMYGAQAHRDPQRKVYGERTQVSDTFQRSFAETSQQGESLRDEQPSYLSNGATGEQQCRSRSRVSSLIQAFNSEGYMDGAGMDGKLREWNDEAVWDKSALMRIQKNLSEVSTAYQQNSNSAYFPSSCPFTSQDTNLYSSDIAAAAHINSESSFMRSSHNKSSMSAQVTCNSNFFIHSEFSPFKVWKDHNRFPFPQGEVCGFLHCSEFSKWYETPMYKKLSLETQQHGSYRRSEEGAFRYPRNNMAHAAPTTSCSTSTSTMPQKALAVKKRCESELAGYYPERKRKQSLGANSLPKQRPSTTSPTGDISRHVQDTICSVKALQQKIKMKTEQNATTGTEAKKQEVLCSIKNLIPFGSNVKAAASNVVSSNTSTTPLNISQVLTPLVHTHQETESSEVWQYAVSPQPVEHPPVRAESRGATPDVRISSYKSKATSLLFNVKDNRKRVKRTYSPTRFKDMDTLERNKQQSAHEPQDTVIEIPDFPDLVIQSCRGEESSRTDAVSDHHLNQYQSHGFSLAALNSQPATAQREQYFGYSSGDYQSAQIQGEMVHHSGFTGFMVENGAGNQLANGQNLHEDFSSLTPYKQGMMDNVETVGGDIYRLKSPYTATETPRLNSHNNQTREHLISKANIEQHLNETVGREFTKVKHNNSNVSSQDRWRHTNNQDTENISLKTAISPWKQEITALMEKDEVAQTYERAATVKEELNLLVDKYRVRNQQSLNKHIEKIESKENFNDGKESYKNFGLVNPNVSNYLPQYAPFRNKTGENQTFHGQQQHGVFEEKGALQKSNICRKIEMKDTHLTKNHYRFDQEFGDQQNLYSSKDKTILMPETGQRKSTPKGNEMQSLKPIAAKPQFEHEMLTKSVSNPDRTSAPTIANQTEHRQLVEVKAEQATAVHSKAQHAQTELAKPQNRAQVAQPKTELDRIILAEQTCSDKVKEQTKAQLKEPGRGKPVKSELMKKITEGHAEQSKEKQSDWVRKEQTEQKRVQTLTDDPKHITEVIGVRHMRKEQREQVNAEPSEAERLKEEHLKTEPAETEQTRIKHIRTEQAIRERIRVEEVEQKQVRDEKLEREQIRIERVKAEQSEAEGRTTIQYKAEQIKEEQAKGEQEKNNVSEGDLIQVKLELHTRQSCKAIKEKAEQRKAEQPKLEETNKLAKADVANTEKCLQEILVKPTATLTLTQQAQTDPDKVEQVKTELAKAKAELVKIKEKMREEQKDKIRNAAPNKDDGIKKDPLRVDIDKNEENKQQGRVFVNRQSSNQANRGADDYESLREKYGVTGATLTNRNKLSAAGNLSANAFSETQALTFDKIETTNDEQLKDKHSPENRFATAKTENNEEVGSFKSTEVTETHYVYSDSSKEFKLSCGNYLTTSVDRANSDVPSDKVKDEREQKLEKCDPLKHTDVSQQRDSDLVKLVPPERKVRSAEHSVGSSDDPNFTPTRALSQKERAQTKQEILTSKIKAHAEKEISAIKERGFAKPEGVIPQIFTKQLAGSQRPDSQKPLSHELSNMHESSVSNNCISRPSEIQIEPIRTSSPTSCVTVPLKSAVTTNKLTDYSQNVAKEPVQSNAKVPKEPRESSQTGTDNTITNEGLIGSQESLIKSEENTPNNKQGYQEASHVEIPGKQKEKLYPTSSPDHLSEKKKVSSQARVLVEAENSKPTTVENSWSTHEAVNEDSAPSLKLVFGQNENPAADDSLQIVGIMVTVQERRSSVNNDHRNNSPPEEINPKENKGSSTELDKEQPSSIVELRKGQGSSVNVKAKSDQNKVSIDIHAENVQEMSTLEIRQNNQCENVPVKLTDLQQVDSFRNAIPQFETQFQEPLAEKGMPSTVTLQAKNKQLAQNERPLYKQEMIAKETKDYINKTAKEPSTMSTGIDEIRVKTNTRGKNPQQNQTAHTSETKVNTEINCSDDSSRVDAETLLCVETPLSMKQDPFKSKSINGKDSPEHIANYLTPARNEERKDSFGDKLGYELSSEKELSNSLEISKLNSINTTNENTQAENENFVKVTKSGKSVGESNVQPMEDYFQVQWIEETNNKPHSSVDVSKRMDLQGLNKAAIGNDSYNEGKNHVLALAQSKMKTVDSSSVSVEDDKMGRKNRETNDNLASEQSDCSKERQSNKNDDTDAAQSIHITKQQMEVQPSLPARERQISRDQFPTRENTGKEKSEVKPKPVRVSTMPEISAIADYARLKVIVSEDQENPIQEFPPKKKDGFFPLIQSRHSRRPVFTADPPNLSVKEKSLPNKTEVSSKVNKEPKPLVFPITEKEHQRTGMFKLGDKERQEKMFLNAKANEYVLGTGAKHAHLEETNKSPTNYLENQGCEVTGTYNQRVCHVDQNIPQSNNSPQQATTSSSEVNMQRNTSVAQQRYTDNYYPNEYPSELVSNAERMPSLDQNSHPQPIARKVFNIDESKQTKSQVKVSTQYEETETKQKRAKQPEEEQASKIEVEKRTKDMKIKQMIEERKASLAEEERRAAQRLEERRAREREAIALQLKQRREKQRGAERRAEENRKAKQAEEERAARQEEMRTKQQEAAKTVKEQKRRINDEEERRAKLREEDEQKINEERRMRRLKQQEEERAAQEGQQRRDAQQEQQMRAATKEEQQRKAAQVEHQRKASQEAEQQRRAAQEERQRSIAQEEQRTTAAQEEKQRRAAQEERLRRAAQEEHQQKVAQEEQQRRAAQEEQQRRAEREEQQRRAAQEQQQKRPAQEEQRRTAAQENERKKRAAQEEKQRRAAQEEHQQKAAQEEPQRRAAQEEQQRRVAREEQQKRAAQKEQQKRPAQQEQQRRAAQEREQQRKIAQEEQQKRAAHEREQQRKTAQEEQQRRVVQEEQQRKAAQEEQQKRAEHEREQQRRAVQEEETRAAQEYQQMRATQEEQQKRPAQEEQQRTAAQENERQRKTALEEQQRKAAQEERQRRAEHEREQQRRAAQEEQHRRAAQEEEERRAAQEEQQRRATQEEQQRRAAREKHQRRASQEEQQRRATKDEHQSRATQEEQQRRTDLIEEQRRAKNNIPVDIEEDDKRKQREGVKRAQISEERIKQTQRKTENHVDEPERESQGEEEKRNERIIIKEREEKQAEEERIIIAEESQAALKEEKRVLQKQTLAQRENEISAKKREEEKQKLSAYREKERASEIEEQKRAAQLMNALQYYTINSTESEKKARERQLCSPSPSPQRNISASLEATEDSHMRLYRPHAPSSPAPFLTRSNTSSPALGNKPSMFRVKDNTFRGSTLIKSVKPRFHKNFGEGFRVGSSMGSERVEEEQETVRRSAATPFHLDTGYNGPNAIKESTNFQPAYSSQDFSAPLPHHRPYSTRIIALDEEDTRSVISTMSEDVESFATSATDLADVRGLYDHERPESSCSFSSDVCRPLGKPPAVLPKSEKAMCRAKRLTTRRIKKELSKGVADSAAGAEEPFQGGSDMPSSPSTEVHSSSRHAVATAHFSPPVSLAYAPKSESSLPSSHTEQQSSHSSFSASPHITGPISLPTGSPHVAASVSLPIAFSHATGSASNTVSKAIANIPSSPTIHPCSHPAPVAKYHVESSYTHSSPLTQRKVLQDVGSGQYFVVDVPVQVKMKTFFDPDTGKYIQLKVRESTKRTSQPQQAYLQPQLQPQIPVKPQQHPPSHDSPAAKPLLLYQDYHGHPQSYQPVGINSVPLKMSSAPVTLRQEQQPAREIHSCGYQASEMGQTSEGYYYSPEKAPYMDTVSDKDKTYSTVYDTHGSYESFPECVTNRQPAGSSVRKNNNSARAQYGPRDIITMRELDDFMDLSDW